MLENLINNSLQYASGQACISALNQHSENNLIIQVKDNEPDIAEGKLLDVLNFLLV
jgi:K+-sensing histidine kinase KdpD